MCCRDTVSFNLHMKRKQKPQPQKDILEEFTVQGSNISPKNGHVESMIVRTSRLVGYVKSPWRVYCFIGKSVTHLLFHAIFTCDFGDDDPTPLETPRWKFPTRRTGEPMQAGKISELLCFDDTLHTYSDMFRHFKHCLLSRIVELGP